MIKGPIGPYRSHRSIPFVAGETFLPDTEGCTSKKFKIPLKFSPSFYRNVSGIRDDP